MTKEEILDAHPKYKELTHNVNLVYRSDALKAMQQYADQETLSLQLKIKQLQDQIQLLNLELSGITGVDSV